MSFLGKRSGSQRSFTNGEDEISVRRIFNTDVSISKSSSDTVDSESSTCSSVQASNFAVHDSCVIRNFPKQKSSHIQFLAWVAYTRKFTNEYITEDERRRCPLTGCRELFIDQEAMLQHVWDCPHLAEGLYYCFHCNKDERVGKASCRRCQGSPSRKDRMASVAKKIFSRLGKQHRIGHASTSPPLQSFEEYPKEIENSKPSPPSYSEYPTQQDQSVGWSHPEAHELASSSMIPEMAGDWTATSYELADTFIAEMADTECPIELGGSTGMWEENYYAENLEEWNLPPLSLPRGRGFSPKLEIDTSFAHNSQPNNWSQNPLSADIISPMSAFGNSRPSNRFSSIGISPTDSDTSGNSFLTDSGYSSATQSATFSAISFSRFPSINETKETEREFGTASDAWLDDTSAPVPQFVSSIVANPVIIASDAADPASKADLSLGNRTETPSAKFTTPQWHDAPSLVVAFSESLSAHMQHTKSKLQGFPRTCTTLELTSMSITSIVSIGLEVLTGILEGRTPTAMTQIFAFTHIACALAIAIEDDEAIVLTQKWFQDTLQWSAGLRGSRQQKGYEEVARAIWQPVKESAVLETHRPLQHFQQNSLSTSCRNFLDMFEILDSSEAERPTSVQRFNFMQASFEHKAGVLVLNELAKKPQIEAFLEDILAVERRLQQGQITSIRDLELELIFAGKLASKSNDLYSLFLQHVAALCDKMYSEDPTTMSRTRCHVWSISRIRQLMPDESNDEEAVQTETSHLQEQSSLLLDIDDEYLNFFQLDLDCEAAAHRNPTKTNEDYDVAMFGRDCDDLLQFSHGTQVDECSTCSHNTSLSTSSRVTQQPYPPTVTIQPSTSTSTSAPAQAPPFPSTAPSPSHTTQTPPSEIVHRCHCGYIPTGEEKWKMSNLRRHKRIQHATESKVYFCRRRGCKSTFTRSDNLRCHVREKGHFDGADGDNGDSIAEEGNKKRRKKKQRTGEGFGVGGALR